MNSPTAASPIASSEAATAEPSDTQSSADGSAAPHRHEPADTVLLDVDGTLVDSTYHHALAWYRAFRRHDIDLPVWRVHRAIGMGGDTLVPFLLGDEVNERIGDALRKDWMREYQPLIDEVSPLEGAADLVRSLKKRGFKVALASSGEAELTDSSIEKLGIADLLDGKTSSGDAEKSKPEPDIFEAALKGVDGTRGIVIGDSVYDVQAAAAMGSSCVCVRTGGFGKAELEAAGAVLVVDGPKELIDADWDEIRRR
jgi:HAD superfamily hydrolase (TIGR01549 family)